MDNKEAAIMPAAAQPDVTESAAAGGSPARRRLLTAGFAGAATSLLPWLNGKASATTPTDGATSGSADPAPTTTLAPIKHPTEADIPLLDFAQSVELTIRDLYDVALDALVFDDAIARDIAALREAHEGYATSIAGLIGRDAGNKPNIALFDELAGDFSGDPDSVAAAAAQLEDVAVATHIDLIGELVAVDGAALIASIVVIESRNATLLRAIAGVEDLAGRLASDADALSPTDYPVE